MHQGGIIHPIDLDLRLIRGYGFLSYVLTFKGNAIALHRKKPKLYTSFNQIF